MNVGTLPQKADGYSDPVTLSADLTALAGKIGFIGFKYIGGGTATGTYQIDNLYVGKEAGGVDPDPDPEENTVLLKLLVKLSVRIQMLLHLLDGIIRI